MDLFDTKFIAHRGLHSEFIPENSLEAFKEAIKNNYVIELDVHLTKDNYVVVFHDDNLKRMTGVNKLIKECTLSEIKEYNLVNSKYKIPTLEEALELVNGKTAILLEIKTDNSVGLLEKRVHEMIKEYSGIIYFQSFRIRTCIWLKLHKYKCGPLVGSKKKKIYYWYISLLVRILKFDFISISISNLSNKYLKKVNQPKLVWTIRNEDILEKIFNKVDGVIFESLPSCVINKKVI